MKMEEETTQAKIEAIKAAERTKKDKATLNRLLIIRLLLEGYTIPQVMLIANRCEKTVYNCQARYAAEGVSGLTTKPIPGRDTKLTDEQERRLYETIKTKLPSEAGYAPFANWTSPLAVQWVKKNFGVKFSERGMRNLFERIGLSYTRPTYTLKKADPEKQAAFKDEFEKIKKTDF
jgi:putative transposase